MASYNRVILLGNLTRDVEMRYTPGGTAVTDIGLAVNDRRKNISGEWVDEVTFVDVTLWGRTAEVASEYLHKGAQVLIEGRLKLDTWESEGQKRSKLRVVCERMQTLGRATERYGDYHEENGARTEPQQTSPVARRLPAPASAPVESDEYTGEIPF